MADAPDSPPAVVATVIHPPPALNDYNIRRTQTLGKLLDIYTSTYVPELTKVRQTNPSTLIRHGWVSEAYSKGT